ncbi:MAG: hypothetical protein GXO47_11300 [Chlorobi bacterium]|nr:hypothetical protein [Chlorobiota bacterium]
MDTAELKLVLFRKIDSLDSEKLQEVYGWLENYLNSHIDMQEWDNLSNEQKQGLYDAISDVDKGNWIAHEDVMEKYRKKYRDG